MRYEAFKQLAMKFTREQLRCEATPCDGILELINAVGLTRYESYVERLLREADSALSRMAYAGEYR